MIVFLAGAAACGVGAWTFWSWRENRLDIERGSADMTAAITGGYISESVTGPSLVPLWLLLALALVFVLAAVAAGVAAFLTSTPDAQERPQPQGPGAL